MKRRRHRKCTPRNGSTRGNRTRSGSSSPFVQGLGGYILLSIFWLENEFATFRYPVARAQPGRLRPKRAAQHLIFRGEYRRGAKGGRRLPGRLDARRRMHERGRRGADGRRPRALQAVPREGVRQDPIAAPKIGRASEREKRG